MFEGEYKEGKRNGYGKEYDSNSQLIFEGEYLNDNKWEGKGYNGINNIVYELKNGKG
jgi:antitoxin component YwqK of YwqJK toxin-antitoxin module